MKKKKIIIISTIGILILGGVGTGVFLMKHKTTDTSAEVATETDAEVEEEVTTEELAEVTTEEKTTEAKKEDKEKADKDDKKEQGKETTTESVANANTGTTQAQNSNSKPQNTDSKPQPTTAPSTTQSTPKPESTPTTEAPKPPTTQAPSTTQEQKKVWVVDEPAWDEEYPVYENRTVVICTGCGGKFYSQSAIESHSLDCLSSWYTDSEAVIVGYETEHHEEKGHWEYQ